MLPLTVTLRVPYAESEQQFLLQAVKAADLPPVVRPSLKFLHADTLSGANVRVSGAGGRYPSALCGRCVL